MDIEQRENINHKCWLKQTNARGGNTSYICPTFGESERITLLQGLISTKCSKRSEKKNVLIKHNSCGDTVKGQYCFLGEILYCDEGFSGPKDKPYLRPPTPGTFAWCVLQAPVSIRTLPLSLWCQKSMWLDCLAKRMDLRSWCRNRAILEI